MSMNHVCVFCLKRPKEVVRFPWKWSYRQLQGMLGTKPRLSEEQPALLTTESSPQSSTIFITIIPILELYILGKMWTQNWVLIIASLYDFFPTWNCLTNLMITIAIVCRTTVIKKKKSCGILQQDKKCIAELLYKWQRCFLLYVTFSEFVCWFHGSRHNEYAWQPEPAYLELYTLLIFFLMG